MWIFNVLECGMCTCTFKQPSYLKWKEQKCLNKHAVIELWFFFLGNITITCNNKIQNLNFNWAIMLQNMRQFKWFSPFCLGTMSCWMSSYAQLMGNKQEFTKFKVSWTRFYKTKTECINTIFADVKYTPETYECVKNCILHWKLAS